MTVGAVPEQDLERMRTWARGRTQVEIDVDGRDAVVVEVQPPWHGRDLRSPVARLRWVASRGVWQLSCRDGNLTWHRYGPLPEGRLDVLLREIERDPTCIFWG